MGLAETLGARAARKGRSAPVECGELGILTVEALPVRELELLLRGPDGQRAVFYAACRELQSAGEALRKAGKVFTPDGIMQFVSDGEAEAAAEVVLSLSGEAAAAPPEQEDGGAGAENAETKREHFRTKPHLTSEREFRLAPVQLELEAAESETAPPQGGDEPALAEGKKEPGAASTPEPSAGTKREQVGTKAETARTKWEQNRSFRLASVQKTGTPAPGFGQVSRETAAEKTSIDTLPKADKKSQAMGISSPERTQNVVAERKYPPAEENVAEAPEKALHETESDFSENLHETESEFRDENRETVHEITSEFGEAVHETTSEFRVQAPQAVHEITSEFSGSLHETKSDFGETRRVAPHETESESSDGLHEMTSEYPVKDRAALHENTSELAEDVARRLVEGLRRAKWVRGD